MDRRNQKSINAIRNAMTRLLKDKPLNEITMTELGRTADINRSTLYSYYDNPQEIFSKLADESIQGLTEALGNAKYSMTDFIRIYLQHMKEHYAIFLEIHRSSISNPYVREIAAIMNQHLEGRSLETDSIIYKYCNYGFFGIAAEWLMSGCGSSIEEIIQELLPIMRVFEHM